MSEPIYISGLLRQKINLGTPERPRSEFYYLINLEELTTSVVDGVPSLEDEDSQRKDFWTDLEIAQLLFNLSPSALAEMDDDDKLRHAANTRHTIDGKLSKQAWDYARSKPQDPQGWYSTMVNPEGSVEMGPTILFVPERSVRNRFLQQRFKDLIAQRKAKAFYEDTHYLARLAEFRRTKLEPLQNRQAKLDESLAAVRHATSRVANAHLAVVAMFHCAESADERKKRWNRRPPIETEPSVFADQLVPRMPEPREVDAARRVRDRFIPSLFAHLTELSAWMASGASKGGKRFQHAFLRNNRASELLDALRANEDILLILENHLTVDRFLWRAVEHLLLECVHSLLLAPNTREAILNGELGHLAMRLAGKIPALELPIEHSRRARAIHEATEQFNLQLDLPQPTRLTKALLELKSHADPVLDHRSTLTKIWSLATPTLMEHIEAEARARGYADPSAVASSWGWRSAFALIDLDEEAQKEVLKKAVVDFGKAPTTANARSIFETKALQVENRFWNTTTAWSAYETTIAILSATDAMAEYQDDPTTDKAIGAWAAALEAVKAVPDFAATLTETQTFIRMASGPGKSLLSKLAGLADATPMKVLGGVITVLKLEATARATRAVLESKTASANDKDVAREQAALSYIGTMVSATGTILGSPFVLAGTVLFLGGAVLLNRKVWNACLSNIEGLPGPGRAVRLAWQEIVDGSASYPSVQALANGTPWETRIKDGVEDLRLNTLDASEIGGGSFWPLCSGDFIMAPRVSGMLKRQYGFNLEFAKELAAY